MERKPLPPRAVEKVNDDGQKLLASGVQETPERKCGPARENTGLGLAAPWALPGSTSPSMKWASGNLCYPTGGCSELTRGP